MDPVALIAAALAAGAAAGTQDTASAAVRDGYSLLKSLVAGRLGSRKGADVVLAQHETAPDTWHAPLLTLLRDAQAERDAELVRAAQTLMGLVDTGSFAVGANGERSIAAHENTGIVSTGDHATNTLHGDRP